MLVFSNVKITPYWGEPERSPTLAWLDCTCVCVCLHVCLDWLLKWVHSNIWRLSMCTVVRALACKTLTGSEDDSSWLCLQPTWQLSNKSVVWVWWMCYKAGCKSQATQCRVWFRYYTAEIPMLAYCVWSLAHASSVVTTCWSSYCDYTGGMG